MSEELKLPENLNPAIADFLSTQNYQNRMCIRNVNTLAETLAQNAETITSEVFFGIMNRLNKTEIAQLPDIYAVRNAVTALLQGSTIPTAPAPAAPVAAPKNEPVLAFAGTVPAEAPEPSLFDRPAAPEGAPTPKRLGASNKSPVLSTVADLVNNTEFASAAEALVAAPEEVKTELEEMVNDVMAELPFDLDEKAADQIIEADFTEVVEPVPAAQETITEAAVEVVAEEPAAAKVEDAPAPRKTRGKAAVATEADEIIKQLLGVIDERDTRIKQLEKALADAETTAAVKLSSSTANRLKELGILT